MKIMIITFITFYSNSTSQTMQLLIPCMMAESNLKRQYDKINVLAPCDAAFSQFKKMYSKQYTKEQEVDASLTFCINLKGILELRRQKPSIEVMINSHADRKTMNSMLIHPDNTAEQSIKNLAALIISSRTDVDGQYNPTTFNESTYNNGDKSVLASCGGASNAQPTAIPDEIVNFVLTPTSKLPFSVDLREWGITGAAQDQGTCGSCYAFTARAIMSALVAHDLPYYKKIYPTISELASGTSATILLSVQMILNDTYGYNQYCGGGNFIYAAIDTGTGYLPSMEFESTVPYSAMFDAEAKPTTAPKKIPVTTTEFKTRPLNPIHWFNNGANKCPGMTITINDIGDKGVNAAKVKQILAAGVPLAGHMKAGNAGPALQFYRSGIIEGVNCTDQSSDHQITLAGYGHYQGTAVWLYLNSWGQEWGQMGYFMVAQGSNHYCSEMKVYAVLPRFIGYSTTDWAFQQVFNESKVFQDNKAMYVNSLVNNVRRGANGMDNYDATGKPIFTIHEFDGKIWIVIVILGIFGLLFAWAFVKYLFCPGGKIVGRPIYIKYNLQSMQKMNWPVEPEDQGDENDDEEEEDHE